ncbi:MAG: rhodanese-like domain-containing protein [Acidimicrobiia bacterium]|nr:rhodanese-like domain-containing protein [Acidimicrobiia bacterium]
MTRRLRVFVAAMTVLSLVATACGDDDGADTSVATTAAPATTTTTVAAFDLVESVDAYLGAIPAGYMNVGDVTAFKDAVEASGATIIDVRTEGEYAEGHIEGAINIPLSTLGDNLDKVPTDTQVFVQCKSGHRAALAVSSLRMLGYDNVLTFAPGINGWTEAGEPLVTTMPAEVPTYQVPEIPEPLMTAVGAFLSGMPQGYITAGGVDDVKTAMDNDAFLLDVRTTEEFANGHIGDAVNIPLHDVAANLDAIPMDRTVIVYCGSGYRAALAAAALQSLGYDNVSVFTGSWKAWKAAGEPVSQA